MDDAPLLLFSEQILTLKSSGLGAAADEIHIGMPGQDHLLAAALSPDKAILHDVGDGGRGECPTLEFLQQWLRGHEDWAVCYFHMKGVSQPSNSLFAAWRKCMEKCVIWNWETCIKDLESGYDTVGAHWNTNQDQRYWAGNFWWASVKHLLKLPPISRKVVNGKSYESEVWIGKCKGEIRKFPYASGHRLMVGCVEAAK